MAKLIKKAKVQLQRVEGFVRHARDQAIDHMDRRYRQPAPPPVLDPQSAEAQFNCGMGLLMGDGGEMCLEQAAECFQRAADQGHRDAQYRYGICLLEGTGVDKDDIIITQSLGTVDGHELQTR